MDAVINSLAERYTDVDFAKMDVDAMSDLAEQLELSAVPSFFFFKSKALVDKLEGADAAELSSRVERLRKAEAGAGGQALKQLEGLRARLTRLITASPVMLFMKGTPNEPRCKFSRRAVDLLKEMGVPFGSFDILTNPAVRQGLKEMNAWPTYPQLYVKGELVGGVDIMSEMKESGELAALLPARDPTAGGAAVGAAAVAVASAGAAASAAAPAAAQAAPAPAPAAAATAAYEGLTPALRERLAALVSRSPVVLFMKGSPGAEQCGFSARIVELLRSHGLASFDTFDILSDRSVREGLKEFSSWPTFPQLYVKGELIGGLDVLKQMIDDSPGTPLPALLGLA